MKTAFLLGSIFLWHLFFVVFCYASIEGFSMARDLGDAIDAPPLTSWTMSVNAALWLDQTI